MGNRASTASQRRNICALASWQLTLVTLLFVTVFGITLPEAIKAKWFWIIDKNTSTAVTGASQEKQCHG